MINLQGLHGLLSRQLEKYGFMCIETNEKEEVYYKETGRTTTLFIEGICELHPEYGEEFYFDFYKQIESSNSVFQGVERIDYGKHLDCEQIIKRVTTYFENRERYIKRQELKAKRKGGDKYGLGSKSL